MTTELLVGLMMFSFVSSITPGPNNLMLMTSGANFGFRRTIPHMLGVGVGFVLMTVVVGAGLTRIFDEFPFSYTVLKVVSVVYLLFLAWKIAAPARPRPGAQDQSAAPSASPVAPAQGTPISFTQAALFQWVNPKAWAMALTAMSVYNPDHSLSGVLLVALVFGLINLPCVSTWTVLGQQIRLLLDNDRHLRVFNWAMAGLLLVSVFPVLLL